MVKDRGTEPGASIRVRGDIYKKLREIAEKRDCTLGQAMDFLIDRRVDDERGDDSESAKGGAKQPKKWVGGVKGLVEG